jgi:ABC-type cobalamin/Fe3+-siderophores transport system ATPase subunit
MTTWKHYKNLISKSAFDTFFPSFHGKTKQNANAGRIDNDTIVIVGRKGSGKTTILLFLIKLFLKFTKRDILVFTQVPVKNINQQMTKFINLCFQNGRNYGLTIVLVLHHLNTGRERTLLIKEADSIVMFPGSMDNNLHTYTEDHLI